MKDHRAGELGAQELRGRGALSAPPPASPAPSTPQPIPRIRQRELFRGGTVNSPNIHGYLTCVNILLTRR